MKPSAVLEALRTFRNPLYECFYRRREQVKGVLCRLPERDGRPLLIFDAGYDPVRLQQELKGERAQILVSCEQRTLLLRRSSSSWQPTHGRRRLRPIVRGTLVLVKVRRLPRGERRREPKKLCSCGKAPEIRNSTCSLADVREALRSVAHLPLSQTDFRVDQPSG